MRHIGFWIRGYYNQCMGRIATPSILTSMAYYFVNSPVGLNPTCTSEIVATNNALSSFDVAQLTTIVDVLIADNISLILNTPNGTVWYSSITLDGVTQVSGTSGSVSIAVGVGSHTLVFSMNPSGPGSMTAATVTFTARLSAFPP